MRLRLMRMQRQQATLLVTHYWAIVLHSLLRLRSRRQSLSTMLERLLLRGTEPTLLQRHMGRRTRGKRGKEERRRDRGRKVEELEREGVKRPRWLQLELLWYEFPRVAESESDV